MAALLVGLNVMAVLLTVALPVWSHATRREKEEELIWRGQQYARAIRLYQMRYANTFPPSVDVLVDQRFLREKYKDPITGDDFVVVPAGGGVPGQPGIPPQGGAARPGEIAPPGGFGGGMAGGGMTGGMGGGTGPGGMGGGIGTGGFGGGTGAGGMEGGLSGSVGAGSGFPQSSMTAGTQPNMGIQGVMSKSKETSIRIFNGTNQYNQWVFVNMATSNMGGMGGGGFGQPIQPGGAGQPGGVGGSPMPGGFGQPMQPGGGFGQPMQPGPFGQPMQPGGGFGQPMQPGPFGQPAQPGGGFGQPMQPGPFGQPMQPGGFGQPGLQPQPAYPPVPGMPPGGSIFQPVLPPGR